MIKEITFGKSTQGKKIPIYTSAHQAQKYLYLLAGVHGDEPEGTYICEQFFLWWKSHGPKDIPLIVIPSLNVDGLAAKTRTNANGVDLNRNLPSSTWNQVYTEQKYFPGNQAASEVENQLLIKTFDQFKPGLVFSFHSWKPFLNYDGPLAEIAQYLATSCGYPIILDIGNPTPGSLGSFGPEKYNASILTLEFPILKDEEFPALWELHKPGLTSLVKTNMLKKHL